MLHVCPGDRCLAFPWSDKDRAICSPNHLIPLSQAFRKCRLATPSHLLAPTEGGQEATAGALGWDISVHPFTSSLSAGTLEATCWRRQMAGAHSGRNLGA